MSYLTPCMHAWINVEAVPRVEAKHTPRLPFAASRKVSCTMGKRKSRAKPAPRKRMDKLDTVFSCPFCNHGTSVEFKLLELEGWAGHMGDWVGNGSCISKLNNFMTIAVKYFRAVGSTGMSSYLVLVTTFSDMKNLIGEASCRICQENFSTTITALTEPIDIYSEWIDECERVNTVDDDGVPVDDDDV
ncbi:transcription elongation factor 1 [Tanacetum coccineum]